MKEIVGFLVDLCVKHGFLKPGWENRLSKSLEDIDVREMKSHDDLCSALAHTNKDGYVCCVNAPNQKKLGDGSRDDMEEVCGACDRVKDLRGRIERLEEERKKQRIVNIPQCSRGGVLQDDGARMYCPINGGFKTIQRCEAEVCWGLKTVRLKGRFENGDHR